MEVVYFLEDDAEEPHSQPQTAPPRPFTEAEVEEYKRRFREQGAGVDVVAGR